MIEPSDNLRDEKEEPTLRLPRYGKAAAHDPE
jgi:hypothetical protein